MASLTLAELLESLRTLSGVLPVTITISNGLTVTISTTAAVQTTSNVADATPSLPTPGSNNADWKWLSANEEAFVRAATRDWQTLSQLLEKAGIEDSRDLSAILRNLVQRRILESAPSRGYRLASTEPQLSPVNP